MSQIRINLDTNQNVANHIKKVYYMLGISADKLPSKDEVGTFIQMYKAAFKDYTILEIEYAVDLAIRRVIDFNFNLYDKVFSVVYVSELMGKYRAWRKVQPEYKKAKAPEQLERGEDEIFNNMKTACIKRFNDYKAGDQDALKFFTYDWLNKNGVFTPTDDFKRAMYKKANEQLDQELKEKKAFAVSPLEIKLLIEKYSQNTLAINRAKELSLKEYFDGLIEMDINLNDQI